MSVKELAAQIGFTVPAQYNCARLLWDNAIHGERVAIIHDGGQVSYGELIAEAARIGNHLRAMAEPGERVLLLMDDEPAYPAAIMGAMRAGLVPMLINTLSPPDLLRFFLDDSGARVAVASGSFAKALDGMGCTVLDATERPWADAPAELAEHPSAATDMAFWMYSSGSTGRPKGVVHLHRDVPYIAAAYGTHYLKLTADDICFSVPKIYFAYGFGNSVVFPMAAGASAVLMQGRPEPARVLAQIERHRPTAFFGLPTLYTALMHAPEAAQADLSSLRLCLSAAEVLSAEIANAWRGRCGLPVIEGLGSTEMLHIYLSNTAEKQVPGSAGQVVPGYAVRLTTPEGHKAAPGEEGVMEVCGLSRTPGYWNRPDKNAETIRGEWLNTGDRFVADSDGNYFFRGRADDLVKVSGQWVWPMEIELALNEHPAVRESCVLAVPLADGRTTIRAFVSLRAGQVAGDDIAKALQSHAKAKLLPHKYPRQVIFLDDLPKTGTDKIDRQALRRIEPESAARR
ncbi:MAG: benzoate-CoA ligase family protein [Pararhodobacter sp.]|nr:benzoate-CoA ligase family protein [Pararhodobacter sp.]